MIPLFVNAYYDWTLTLFSWELWLFGVIPSGILFGIISYKLGKIF